MKYKAPKRGRIKYGFMGITTFEGCWSYIPSLHKWTEDFQGLEEFGRSSHQDCNSIRAFRRKLKKCPKGVEFILVSRWVGYDVIGYNTTK